MESDLTVIFVCSEFYRKYLKFSVATVPAEVAVHIAWVSETAPPADLPHPERVKLSQVTSSGSSLNKSRALNTAIRAVATDWVFIADADMLFPSFFFDLLLEKLCEWTEVRRFFIGRFTEAFTKRIIDGKLSWEELSDVDSGVRVSPPFTLNPIQRGMLHLRSRLISAAKDAVFGKGTNYSSLYASPNPCLYSRRLLLELGGYDEDFEGWGGEDIDLFQRGLRIGAREIRMPLIVGHLYHPPVTDYPDHRAGNAYKELLLGERPIVPRRGL